MLIQTAVRRGSPQGRLPIEGQDDVGGSIDCMGALISHRRNDEIYGEREPADYLYICRIDAPIQRVEFCEPGGAWQDGGLASDYAVVGAQVIAPAA